MKYALLACVLCTFTVGTGRAAPVTEPGPWPGVTPEIGLARLAGRGLLLDMVTLVSTQVEKEEKGVVGGRAGTTKVTEVKQVVEHRMLGSPPLGDIKGWTADGEPIEASALVKRLQKWKMTPVVLVSDGKLPCAGYRDLFREDVLILAMPKRVDEGPVLLPGEPMPRDFFRRGLPDICKAQVEDNHVILVRTGSTQRVKTRVVPTEVGGRVGMIELRVPVWETTQRMELLNLKTVKGYSGDGKLLSAEALTELLKKQTVVVTTAASGDVGWSSVEFTFLKLFKDETIVLVLP